MKNDPDPELFLRSLRQLAHAAAQAAVAMKRVHAAISVCSIELRELHDAFPAGKRTAAKEISEAVLCRVRRKT